MIVFIILVVLIVSTLCIALIRRFDNPLIALAAILVFGVIFGSSLFFVKHGLVGDSEKCEFNIGGSRHEMFYDQESEKYFIITATSQYNPINWLGKEYLETEDVEKFLEAYEKHNEAYEELKEIDLFGKD